MTRDHKVSLTATLTAAVATLIAGTASAQVHPEKPTYPYEKCYGVAKAGMNDCFFASNSCAGTVAADNVPGAWIYVPKGTCKKIVGGSLDSPN